VCERSEEPLIRSGIGPEAISSFRQRELDERCCSTIERMRQGKFRLNEVEPISSERQLSEKRRSDCEGMYGRANIVQETGHSEFGGTQGSAESGVRFKQDHRQTRLREANRCR
jgi:hypothetical protein